MTKQFGVADLYQATRLAETSVLITAVGEAPNLNTIVTLEMLPWKIYPPQFGLFFETPQVSLPATRPFLVWGIFPYPGVRTIWRFSIPPDATAYRSWEPSRSRRLTSGQE